MAPSLDQFKGGLVGPTTLRLMTTSLCTVNTSTPTITNELQPPKPPPVTHPPSLALPLPTHTRTHARTHARTLARTHTHCTSY